METDAGKCVKSGEMCEKQSRNNAPKLVCTMIVTKALTGETHNGLPHLHCHHYYPIQRLLLQTSFFFNCMLFFCLLCYRTNGLQSEAGKM